MSITESLFAAMRTDRGVSQINYPTKQDMGENSLNWPSSRSTTPPRWTRPRQRMPDTNATIITAALKHVSLD